MALPPKPFFLSVPSVITAINGAVHLLSNSNATLSLDNIWADCSNSRRLPVGHPPYYEIDAATGVKTFRARRSSDINWASLGDICFILLHPLLCDESSSWMGFLPLATRHPSLYEPFVPRPEQDGSLPIRSLDHKMVLTHYLAVHWFSLSLEAYLVEHGVSQTLLPRPSIDHAKCLQAIDVLNPVTRHDDTIHKQAALTDVFAAYIQLFGWILSARVKLAKLSDMHEDAILDMAKIIVTSNELRHWTKGSLLNEELVAMWLCRTKEWDWTKSVGTIFCVETPQDQANAALETGIDCWEIAILRTTQ